MLMIAVIVVCGIMYGALWSGRKAYGGHMAVSVEGRISEREKCYKLPELRSIGEQKKFSVSDRLIRGVLRQGLPGCKERVKRLNCARQYDSKYARNNQ